MSLRCSLVVGMLWWRKINSARLPENQTSCDPKKTNRSSQRGWTHAEMKQMHRSRRSLFLQLVFIHSDAMPVFFPPAQPETAARTKTNSALSTELQPVLFTFWKTGLHQKKVHRIVQQQWVHERFSIHLHSNLPHQAKSFRVESAHAPIW